MSEKEDTTERDELLNWNENETFATSEATSRVSDVELLKVRIVLMFPNFAYWLKITFSGLSVPHFQMKLKKTNNL